MTKNVTATALVVGFAALMVASAGSACSSGDSVVDDAGVGPDSSARDAAPTEDLGAAYCAALVERSSCPDAGPARECKGRDACTVSKLMTAEAARTFVSCMGRCGTNDESCRTEAGKAVGGERATEFSKACFAKNSVCRSFSDDLCIESVFAFKGAAERFERCLAAPCEAIAKCFADATKLDECNL